MRRQGVWGRQTSFNYMMFIGQPGYVTHFLGLLKFSSRPWIFQTLRVMYEKLAVELTLL